MWRCPRCETFNDDQRITCEVCSEPNPLKVESKPIIKEGITVPSTVYEEAPFSKHVESESKHDCEDHNGTFKKRKFSFIPVICLSLVIVGALILISGLTKGTINTLSIPSHYEPNFDNANRAQTMYKRSDVVSDRLSSLFIDKTPLPATTQALTSLSTQSITSSQSPFPTTAPQILTEYAATAKANVLLRSNPSSEAMLQAVLKETGTVVGILENLESDGSLWYLVECQVGMGYVTSDSLRTPTNDELTDYLSTPIPSPSPTAIATASPTPMPTPTPTPTSTPVPTPTPTSTPVPTPTPTSTPVPTPPPTPTPTPMPIVPNNDYEITDHRDGTCTITRYLGNESVVTIPSHIEGKSVIGIGQYTFMGQDDLIEIHIADSVRMIGEGAFYQCMNLERITLPQSLATIGNNAFYYCWKVENLTLPNGLKSIGAGAFASMEALKELVIPASVTEIAPNAFRFCKALTSIEIPHGITSLGDGTFGDCYNLQRITIPPTVESFGSDVFFWCGNLCEIWGEPGSAAEKYATELGLVFISTSEASDNAKQGNSNKVYPEGTRIIGDYKISAYADGTCGIMDYYGENKEMIIPEYIGDYKVIEVCGTNYFGLYEGVTSVTIPEGVERIGSWAFIGGDFTEIWIPNSATTIAPNFLDLCDDIEAIHVSPDHPVLKYEQDCLIDKRDNTLILFCGKHSSFDIPDGIVSIGEDAFYNKENLINVTIPSSVRTVQDSAFTYCTNLKSVRISEGVHSIGKSAFSSCYNLTEINLPESLIELGSEAFALCGSLKKLTIPDNLTIIDDTAISSCSGLESITVSNKHPFLKLNNGFLINKDSHVLLGYYGKKTEIMIPEEVTAIGDYSFYCRNDIVSVVIPEGIISIGDSAFRGCESLKKVTIPSTVETIEGRAFFNCGRLRTITILADDFKWDKTSFNTGPSIYNNYISELYGKKGSCVETLATELGVSFIEYAK